MINAQMRDQYVSEFIPKGWNLRAVVQQYTKIVVAQWADIPACPRAKQIGQAHLRYVLE